MRSEGGTPSSKQQADWPAPADACWLLGYFTFVHVCPFCRRWINMRTPVQRAADCVADCRLPQWARWAGAEYQRSATQGSQRSWGLIGPSSMFTLVIEHQQLAPLQPTDWTIPTFSKVLLLLKILLHFQYSICVIYCRLALIPDLSIHQIFCLWCVALFLLWMWSVGCFYL